MRHDIPSDMDNAIIVRFGYESVNSGYLLKRNGITGIFLSEEEWWTLAQPTSAYITMF